MLSCLPKYNENEELNTLLSSNEEDVYKKIVEKMSDKGMFALRTNHERILECAIFCIFSISDLTLLLRILKVLNLSSTISDQFHLELAKVQSNHYLKRDTSTKFSDVMLQEGEHIISSNRPITLLHLLYWRDKAIDTCNTYEGTLSALNECKTVTDDIWYAAFMIGIENKDLRLIRRLYEVNEYALILNGEKYLTESIQAGFYEAIKWLYSKQIKISIEENPFEMLDHENIALKEKGMKTIIESDTHTLLPNLRSKTDVSALVRLRDIDPIEAIRLSENKPELEILMDM